jgi:hypothetical protein
MATNFVLVPLTQVFGSIGPRVDAKALLEAFLIVAQIVCLCRGPRLVTFAMHLALLPETLVDCPIRVRVHTEPAHQI